MGNGYTIDLGELNSLVTTLDTAKESMSSANDSLKDASASDLGSAGLDSAGKDFQDKWEYGIGKLADLSEKMSVGLRDTQKDYANVEAEVKKMFPNPGGSGSAAPGNSKIGDVLGGAGRKA